LLSVGLAPAAPTPLKSDLIFPLGKIHNHSSSIVELPNGNLLVCRFHGSGDLAFRSCTVRAQLAQVPVNKTRDQYNERQVQEQIIEDVRRSLNSN
jgi:hypothetical protein